jgi:hypothetical protein
MSLGNALALWIINGTEYSSPQNLPQVRLIGVSTAFINNLPKATGQFTFILHLVDFLSCTRTIQAAINLWLCPANAQHIISELSSLGTGLCNLTIRPAEASYGVLRRRDKRVPLAATSLNLLFIHSI